MRSYVLWYIILNVNTLENTFNWHAFRLFISILYSLRFPGAIIVMHYMKHTTN